jgi:hypothetical protein
MTYMTPLEEAVVNAQEVAAGIASMALVRDLLDKSESAMDNAKNRTLPNEERSKGLKDSRHINMVLNLIAQQRSLAGIEA